MTVVAFAGMGRMGSRMAANVLRAGFTLRVWNRSPARCAPLVAAGATAADTPRELVQGADVLVTMVADAAAAERVLLGPDGALAALAPGSIVLEMSTVGPAAAKSFAAAAAEGGIFLLDAPVSGSIPAAESAQLTTMVGGEREAFERARPVLAAMTREQTYLGPSGTGAAMKVALNSVIAVTNQAIAEALVLAEGAGIAAHDAYDVLASSAVGSPFVHYKRAAFLDPADQPVFFTATLMQKDVSLALELARVLAVPMPTAAAANEILTLVRRWGYGEGDIARVLDAMRLDQRPSGGTQ
jgi:3-hydroxyisobutyrate dehydrogenase-like beta-hydroxyacid dehydrogenase